MREYYVKFSDFFAGYYFTRMVQKCDVLSKKLMHFIPSDISLKYYKI